MLQMKSYHSSFPFFCWLWTSSPGCCNHHAHQIQCFIFNSNQKTGTHPSQCRKNQPPKPVLLPQYIATKDTLAYTMKGKEVFGAANFNALPLRDLFHGCFCSIRLPGETRFPTSGSKNNNIQGTIFVKKSWVKNPCHLTVLAGMCGYTSHRPIQYPINWSTSLKQACHPGGRRLPKQKKSTVHVFNNFRDDPL